MVQNRVTRIGDKVFKLGLEMGISLQLTLLNYMAPVEKQIIGFKEIIIRFKEMSL